MEPFILFWVLPIIFHPSFIDLYIRSFGKQLKVGLHFFPLPFAADAKQNATTSKDPKLEEFPDFVIYYARLSIKNNITKILPLLKYLVRETLQ